MSAAVAIDPLGIGTFVRIKCLYTDDQRIEAAGRVTRPTWDDCMNNAMGQIGVIESVLSTCWYGIRYIRLDSGDKVESAFHEGWFTVIHNTALKVPRDTAAKLGYPLSVRTRKRLVDPNYALEDDTHAEMATLANDMRAGMATMCAEVVALSASLEHTRSEMAALRAAVAALRASFEARK